MRLPIIGDEQVKPVVRMSDAISAIERVLSEVSAGQARNIPRIAIETEKGVFRLMAAYSPSLKLAGVNQGFWSSGFAGDKEKAKGSGLLSLYNTETAELAGVVAAPSLNSLRVSAVTAVGVKHLSNPDAKAVALFGSSSQARTQLLGVAKVRDIEEVKVYSRNRSNRERFCTEMEGEVDAKLAPVGSPRDALAESEIVLDATDANEPVFDGKDLADGAYVSSIKTGRHGTRQIDDEAIRRSSLFVIDFREQALVDGAGDVIIPITRGLLEWSKVVELGDIISKKVPGRRRKSDVVVFKSCGMAISDLAIARLVLDARDGAMKE